MGNTEQRKSPPLREEKLPLLHFQNVAMCEGMEGAITYIYIRRQHYSNLKYFHFELYPELLSDIKDLEILFFFFGLRISTTFRSHSVLAMILAVSSIKTQYLHLK